MRTYPVRFDDNMYYDLNSNGRRDENEPWRDYFKIPVYEMTVVGTKSDKTTETKKWKVLRFSVAYNPDKRVKKYRQFDAPHIVGLADKQVYYSTYLPSYRVHNAATSEVGAFKLTGNFLIHDGPDDLTGPGWAAFGCVEVAGSAAFDEFKKFAYKFSTRPKPKPIEEELVDMGNRKEIRTTLEQAKIPSIEHVDGRDLPKSPLAPPIAPAP